MHATMKRLANRMGRCRLWQLPRPDALVALLLILALLPWPAPARELGQQAEGATDEPLRVEVVEGEGAINNIRELLARQPVVRVTDAAGKPIFGASVTFSTPAMGASATFVDGSNQAIVVTNERGIARVDGMRPNNIVGAFEIRVTASFAGRRATARINQTNAAPSTSGGSSGSGKGLLILLLVAGAGAGAAFALGGSNGSGSSPAPGGGGTTPPPPPAITITPGSPTFGPP